MTQQFYHTTPGDNTPTDPHKLTRDLCADWESMDRSDRRIRLQALPITDLVALCHLLAEHRPQRYCTPDFAWFCVRGLIEPDPWAPDIKWEFWSCGGEYVFFYGGTIIACHDEHWKLWQTARTWFDGLYPVRLIDVNTEVIYAAA